MTDKAGRRPGLTGSERGCLTGVAVLALGILLTLVGAASLIIHHDIRTPAYPYEVAFGEEGDECADDVDLFLDRTTGEQMKCSALPLFEESTTPQPSGDFTAREVTRILDLADSLAGKDGLDRADQQVVRDLVLTIGRENGEVVKQPGRLERVTGAIGPECLVLGLVCFFGAVFTSGMWADP
ncbi:hypothetical protein ACH4GE_36425 [Streptomyces tendae]|uniref:hypothetical protein n=1 Tax=Streptomyces tendae TaxID=1932 RepID=UPI0037AC4ADD